MELETRDFLIREVNEDKREVTGIAVPYGVPTDVGGYRESFERGAIASHEGVKLFWNHQEIIGKVVRGEDTDAGYVVTARISDTVSGRDAYTHLKDGNIDRFSVGFLPVEQRDEEGVTVRTKVDLKEVSLVPFPAYAGAQISEVRASGPNNTKEDSNESNTMETNVNEDYEARFNTLERELVAIRENGDTTGNAGHSEFRSAGELVHAVANGSESAKAEIRAYTGSKLADSQLRPGWIDQGLGLISANRIATNLFRHAPLQSDGMSFVIPTFSSSTIQVAKQANEGDTLAYGKLVTANKTITVDTYGGYVEWSKQVKDRSSIDYVNGAVQLLEIDYARKTNAAVISTVLADTGVNTGTGLTLSSSTVANWQGFVDEGVAAIGDNTGLLPDFMWVSRDVFYKIKSYTDTTGRPLMEVNNDGSNTFGSANTVAVSGRFQGINLVVDPALPAKSAVMGNGSAVTVFESPGAPFALGDQNITNLTEQFALYGYLAIGVLNPKALFKVTVA